MSSKDNMKTIIGHILEKQRATFINSPNEKKIICIEKNNGFELISIESKKFDALMYQIASEKSIEPPSEQMMKKLRAFFLSKCFNEGSKADYSKRVHANNDKTNPSESRIYIYLADKNGECVAITKDGFEVVLNKDIPFYSPNNQLPLPRPIQTDLPKFIEVFSTFLNLRFPSEIILILAFMMKALWKDFGAYPFLIFSGPKGTGKSTISTLIKMLIDPTVPFLMLPLKNFESVNALLSNRHLLAFDNLSGLSAELADFLCMVSTGGGNSKRKLYSDDEESSYNIQCPIIFNGIDELTTRTDFLDRSVNLSLLPIDIEKRVSEMELKSTFDKNYSLLFGGVCKLLSECIRKYEETSSTNLPRMTEYARIGVCIEKALNFPEGHFLEVYRSNLNRQSDEGPYEL